MFGHSAQFARFRKHFPLSAAGVITVVAAACQTASADYSSRCPPNTRCMPSPAPTMPYEAPPSAATPYRVEIVDGYGGQLPAYNHSGRFYVMGSHRDRYGVRLSNPTSERVEAVISIDGLDALDGETADFSRKRGYIVPPYQTITIEGFRVSMQDVAAFRFNSVGNSYAASKGKARNVGVIGVAFFKERQAPVTYVPIPEPYVRPPADPPCFYCDDEAGRDYDNYSVNDHAESKSNADAPRNSAGEGSKFAEKSAPAAEPPVTGGLSHGDSLRGYGRAPTGSTSAPAPRARPGLGTQFGERRTAPVVNVSFERSSSTPYAVVTVRYNNRAGLRALGIPVDPPVYNVYDEARFREQADPFPNSNFARPPVGWER